MNYDEIDFDREGIEPIEIPVKVQGKRYVLTEATGEAASRYRSASLRGVELVHNDEDETRVTRNLEQIAEVESILVAACLYTGKEIPLPRDADGVIMAQLVPITTVKSWRSKVVKQLFERVKEISDLGEDEKLESLEKQYAKLGKKIERLRKQSREEALKNSPSGTTTG